MTHQDGEIRDLPFLGNDMKDQLATMGKPLDPADGPGKADAELFEEDLAEPGDDRSEFDAETQYRCAGFEARPFSLPGPRQDIRELPSGPVCCRKAHIGIAAG